MQTTTLLLLITFCIGASFVQRVSGFGFGIFIMTILPSLMPSYGEATTLSGLLAASQSLFVAISLRQYISWKNLLPILATFIAVSYFAINLLSTINDTLLKQILGATLIIISVYFYFFSSHIHLRPSLPIQISMGTLSGMMGGLFAMQGPPAVLYFISSEKSKESYLATTQVYFLVGNIMMTTFRASKGYLTPTVGHAYIYAILAVCIGTIIGRKVFEKISADRLKKIIYIYIFMSGVIALLTN